MTSCQLTDSHRIYSLTIVNVGLLPVSLIFTLFAQSVSYILVWFLVMLSMLFQLLDDMKVKDAKYKFVSHFINIYIYIKLSINTDTLAIFYYYDKINFCK